MGASTQKKGCAFCGALEAIDGGPLAPCESCNMAAYCGEEHQKFDWKRHKMFCKTVQSRNAAALQNRQHNDSAPSDFPFLASESYRHPKTSISSDASTSSSSSNQPSTSSDSSSSLSSNSPKLVSQHMISANMAHSGSPDISLAACKLMTETQVASRIVSTSDPDIQIIESAESRSNRAIRKRPQQATRQFKNHMLNPVYDVDLQQHISSLLANPLKFPSLTQYDAMALRMKFIADHVIKSLNEYGWAVVDNFYGPDHCHQSLEEMETLYNHGLFSPGQLVAKRNSVQAQDVRTDEIFWFDTNDEKLAGALSLRLLISTVDSVTAHFKDRIMPYKVCSRARPMIAVYPGSGTRYVKHVDNPAKDGRCITSIYYCNENWNVDQDGGALRLYPETSATPITINPKADRLIFFFSDRRNPHEVLPTFRKRFAMTIWYYDRDEKDAAMENRRIAQVRCNEVSSGSSMAESSRPEARVAMKQDSMEVVEPPVKWKIERPSVAAPASYPGQPSCLSGPFSLLHNNQFRNPNISTSSLCSSSQFHSSVILPSQSIFKDLAPFASALKFNATGLAGKSGLILGSAPSAFLDARNEVARNVLSQALFQVDDRLSV